MFTTIRLETERLLIRPFAVSDFPAFHALVTDPEIVSFLPEDVMAMDEARSVLDWIIESYRVNTPKRIRKFTVAVVQKETDRIIGWVGLGPLDFNPVQVELYYGIAKEYWGQGFATEAARAMLEYGLDVIGLGRVVAVVHAENTVSVRVLEKIGMIREGTVTSLPKERGFYEGFLIFARGRNHRHAGA